MHRLLISLLVISMFVFLSGCQKDIPEPETVAVKPVKIYTAADEVAAQPMAAADQQVFFVRHQIKGNSLYVECIIPGVSFREESGRDQAKIRIFLNGKQTEEVTAPAFIMNNLSKGKHRVRLEILRNDNSQMDPALAKEFSIVID